MARKPHVSARQKKAFLDQFAELGTITHAARAAGISRRAHYDWLEHDPEYAKAFEEAKEIACDNIEREIIHRAMNAERTSDTLLIFLAKAAMPDKYGDRIKSDAKVTHAGSVDVHVVARGIRDELLQDEDFLAFKRKQIAGEPGRN